MGAEQKGGEQLDKTGLSFFPLPLLKEKNIGIFSGIYFFQFPFLSQAPQETAPNTKIRWLSIAQSVHLIIVETTDVYFLEHGSPKLFIHGAALSPQR